MFAVYYVFGIVGLITNVVSRPPPTRRQASSRRQTPTEYNRYVPERVPGHPRIPLYCIFVYSYIRSVCCAWLWQMGMLIHNVWRHTNSWGGPRTCLQLAAFLKISRRFQWLWPCSWPWSNSTPPTQHGKYYINWSGLKSACNHHSYPHLQPQSRYRYRFLRGYVSIEDPNNPTISLYSTLLYSIIDISDGPNDNSPKCYFRH